MYDPMKTILHARARAHTFSSGKLKGLARCIWKIGLYRIRENWDSSCSHFFRLIFLSPALFPNGFLFSCVFPHNFTVIPYIIKREVIDIEIHVLLLLEYHMFFIGALFTERILWTVRIKSVAVCLEYQYAFHLIMNSFWFLCRLSIFNWLQ